jgi:hypothetical protein
MTRVFALTRHQDNQMNDGNFLKKYHFLLADFDRPIGATGFTHLFGGSGATFRPPLAGGPKSQLRFRGGVSERARYSPSAAWPKLTPPQNFWEILALPQGEGGKRFASKMCKCRSPLGAVKGKALSSGGISFTQLPWAGPTLRLTVAPVGTPDFAWRSADKTKKNPLNERTAPCAWRMSLISLNILFCRFGAQRLVLRTGKSIPERLWA